MKVLQVNCVYNKGSTGKIMGDIHSYFVSEGIDSVICYGRGDKTTDKNVYKTCGELYSKLNNLLSRFTGLMYGGCLLSTQKLISIIKKENVLSLLDCDFDKQGISRAAICKYEKEKMIDEYINLYSQMRKEANK